MNEPTRCDPLNSCLVNWVLNDDLILGFQTAALTAKIITRGLLGRATMQVPYCHKTVAPYKVIVAQAMHVETQRPGGGRLP